jgi:prolyl-tRNA synthetase
VRGCMVIKPWGYALWENIKAGLDGMFKATGHVNAYFPLFIPKSFLEKEAEHVEGFAKECAVVTHHRLEEGPDGGLVPAGELEEPLVVRPTSETIIGATYAKWVQSYRDLPILINQWANVVRWEMRTRLFLRTAEFLWQEGHTVHETEAEALEETRKMLDVYETFAESYMAMPVLVGEKTEGERFPGAVSTLCIEAMMQDGKALQAGTSHFLGQNFAKASEIQYQSREGRNEYAWTTSWGVSTRLIGGMIMTHADDDGMVMPPRLAPQHVVLMPVVRDEADRDAVMVYIEEIAEALRSMKVFDRLIEVVVDDRDIKPGEKGWSWVKKGIPIRAEIGQRELDEQSVFMARRDTGEKEGVSRDLFVSEMTKRLELMQADMLERAKAFRKAHSKEIDSMEDFKSFFTMQDEEYPELQGGFAWSHWCDGAACEEKISSELAVTIRLIPFDRDANGSGACVVCGGASVGRVVFAKSY